MTATIDHAEHLPEVTTPSAAPPDGPVRRVSYRRDPSPWRRRDGALCGALGALGVTGIVVCWFGATDEVVWRDQSGWLIGAIFSTGLIVLGGGLWVLIGMRRVRQGFRDLRRDQRAALGLTRVRGNGAAAGVPLDGMVTAHQMTRVHRPDCILLRGKQALTVAPGEIDSYGRCGVCNS